MKKLNSWQKITRGFFDPESKTQSLKNRPFILNFAFLFLECLNNRILISESISILSLHEFQTFQYVVSQLTTSTSKKIGVFGGTGPDPCSP